MSNPLSHHLEDEQLLRYADGELPARAAANVRSHLEVCWQCRTDLQELQTVIGECVKYRKDVLQAHLPPPPAAWGDLYRRFDEIDAAASRRSLGERVVQSLRFPVRHTRRWAPAALAVAVILAIIYQYEFAPSVEAAALLRRASVAAELTPAKAHRLQIRTRTGRFTRRPRLQHQSAADVEAQAPVAALFQAAHYDWDDPLSAKSYQGWRDQLSDKKDAVTTQHDAQSAEPSGYLIETSSRSSALAQATLKLSMPDLVPTEGRFEFRNHEWVEITEIADAPVQPTESAAIKNDRAPATVQEPKPAAPATAGDELHILGALHELGADLGDPIEVQRSGGEILVTGVGIPAERQRQIQGALGSNPNVVLRFSDAPTPTLQPGDTGLHGTGVNTDEAGLRARMEDRLGGRRYVEQLTRQVLEMSEGMMSRAYALRRLAEQMPPGVEAELSGENRQLLLNLYHDHTSVLGRQEAEIERVLDPVLASLGAPATGAGKSPISAASWQASTEDLFQAARRVDRQVAQMLDAAPAEGHTEQLPAAVRSSLAELRARLEFSERLATQSLTSAGR